MRLAPLTLAFGAALVLALPTARAEDPLRAQAKQLFGVIPELAPELPDNPKTAAKVDLGRMLYFDPRLSESHNISCNSCHLIGLGGADGRANSIGHNWQHGARNAPTVFNAIFNTAQFWDGRAKDLKEQAGGPIVNPIEMSITKSHAVAQLKGIPGYAAPFKAAFPGESDPITYGNIERAIAVFESTLITPDAPFDLWLKGDDAALAEPAKKGLAIFIDAGCAACHNGINIGGRMYAPFGVVEKPGWEYLPPNDHGRLAVTNTIADDYVFKVPGLRNVALTAPYFHSGSAWSLTQAVTVMARSQLGKTLSDSEITAIVAFLDSLTGKQPQVVFPILPPSVATTPQPVE